MINKNSIIKNSKKPKNRCEAKIGSMMEIGFNMIVIP